MDADTYLDALVVQTQTERNAAPENVADFCTIPAAGLGRVALHPARLVHDASLDNAVANGLADNVLRVLLRVEVQLETDIAQRDAAVAQREPADAGLDDVLTQTEDERVRLVRGELGRVRGERRLELAERTRAHGLDDLEVARERACEYRVAEQVAFRDVAHEQFDDDGQLVHRLVEAGRRLRGWRTADRLLQVRMRVRVVELDGADAAQVVQVARKLRVCGALWERRFRDELVGLGVQVIGQVVAEQEVDECRLRLVVSAQRRSTLSS